MHSFTLRPTTKPLWRYSLCAVLAAALVLGAHLQALADTVLRVGHFPNITHPQALIAHHLSRQGKGWFEQRLGPGVRIDWYVYNAGPSAMEAIFADSIDLTYVGPSPAINAFTKARGQDIRIIAGALEGGAALVVQPGSSLRKPQDFRDKRIATPQLGNTQDVAARAWLNAGGLRVTMTGGDALVIPTSNPEQLQLFAQKKLDAAWTVEPWVSLLERHAGGQVIFEERDAVTTVLVSGLKFLNAQRELARRFVAAHRDLTAWIKEHPNEAKTMIRTELSAELGSQVPSELVDHAWDRIFVADGVSRDALELFVTRAKSAGFLRSAPDIGALIEAP
jgi:NitT/TauT family transport system substrate-binding protein